MLLGQLNDPHARMFCLSAASARKQTQVRTNPGRFPGDLLSLSILYHWSSPPAFLALLIRLPVTQGPPGRQM